MRHLLGRAAFIACTLALFSQPSFAVPVPKHHPSHKTVHLAAKPAHRLAAIRHHPLAHTALRGDEDVDVAMADLPVPLARPAQESDPAVSQTADNQSADDRAADDSDAAATDQATDVASTEDLAPPDLSGDDAPRIEVADRPTNWVAFVREHTTLAIQGNAGTWWAHAEGLYDRGLSPSADAVMVFASTHGMPRGHVALVKRVVSDREIIVDHANWMRDGKLYLNMPVMDVSADNDWSVVRVWNERDHHWGARSYPIKGFISARPLVTS